MNTDSLPTGCNQSESVRRDECNSSQMLLFLTRDSSQLAVNYSGYSSMKVRPLSFCAILQLSLCLTATVLNL